MTPRKPVVDRKVMTLSDWTPLPYHLSLVDAQPFAEVIDHIRRSHTIGEIAAECGLSRYELTLVANRVRTRIRQDSAAKLRDGLLNGPWWAEESA